MLALPPLGLYIHIPWCIKKCPYCDFNSHEAKGEIPEIEYVARLIDDFDCDYEFASARKISTIFIGGGTPSTFSANAFDTVLTHLNHRKVLANDAEITLEANPGTVEADKFSDYRAAGINRLSLGIQSFNDRHLQLLGRIHDGNQARKALSIARTAGFENFNVDLMHGLPNQNKDSAMQDIYTALEFEPTHLSWYQLTIEPNTAFYKQPPKLPVDDVLGRIQEYGESQLHEHGFEHYEVSAFSKPNRESQHNVNYWQFGDYIGIGAGAHGKITRDQDNVIYRTRKHKQPNHYLANRISAVAEKAEILESEIALEFLMNSLRLKGGFTTKQFEMRTGTSFDCIVKKVESLATKDLLVFQNGHVATTAKGFRFLNTVLEEFL